VFNLITYEITLSEDDAKFIKNIAYYEHIPEDILIRKLVLDSLNEYRIDKAIELYKGEKLNLNASAQFADVSVRDFMDILETRGINLNLTSEMICQSLEFLAESFKSEKLKKALKIGEK